jgi:hypothetical protein
MVVMLSSAFFDVGSGAGIRKIIDSYIQFKNIFPYAIKLTFMLKLLRYEL